jgi:ATP-dependent helicase/nuclease subunit A
VEFHLIPKGGGEQNNDEGEEDAGETPKAAAGPEDLLAVEREARVVALRLRELHQSGQEIWDKQFQCRRRVEWRDMAVLLRSPSNRVEAFAQEFHKCGVPLQAPRGGFFESTEIMDLLSLLRLLDNPLQDIPLLAVLRSPMVALTLDELAEIRAHSGERRFWTAMRRFHREGRTGEIAVAGDGHTPERTAWSKVDLFLKQFAVWRELARQVALSHCLERALTETDYEAVLKAGERGHERAANVRKFVELVRQYDPYQRQGLFRFLKFVDALAATEQDIEPAPAQTQNAVRLISIHQSKGLEFPVVAVACLGGLFNLGDLHQDVLLDDAFGLCAKAVPAETGARHPALAHWLAARRQRRQSLGEELRLLYVATTRARDRLLLVGTATKKDSEVWEAVAPRAFGNREILSARSPLDWLMLWLPTVTRTEDWQDDGGGVGQLLRWKIWADARELELAADELSGTVPGAPLESIVKVEPEAVETVTQRIRWEYAHKAAAREPAKTSVTALRRKAAELAEEEAKPWGFAVGTHGRDARATANLNAAEVGTLHHEFLRRMSLTGACDLADLQGQLAAMTERQVFSPQQAAALDLAMVAGFWQGEIGREIRTNAASVRRELPFTARFTPVELEQISGTRMVPELGEEFVVVQGVADLVVMRETELWLLDFKTDAVNARELPERAGKYRPQIDLYAAALSAIYQKPVARRWLHFLKPGETVTP